MLRSCSIGQRLKPLAMILSVSFLLGGCVTTGYHAQVSSTLDSAKAGSVEVALADLEKKNPGKDKDLLYFMEKGELQRMKGDYPESVAAWNVADGKVREWEEAVKTDASKVMGEIGSFVLNDTTRRYDGRDYEKVLLSVRLALDYVAQGNWDLARVEIKKMHEREAIISEFRSKELDDAKKKSEEKGLKTTSFKDLKGYPVETLDDPEVKALKNAYESAVANYLAGFVYEALGEPSLAAAGYRKAIEMRGGDKFLEQALAGLDGRAGSRRGSGPLVDTLILVESGNAPAITSRMLPIPLPIPGKGGLRVVMTPLSWPVVEKADASVIPTSLLVNDKPLPLSMVTSVDHMARRAIADEMPGIIVRSSIRAIVKGAAQKAIQDNASGMAGAVLGIAAGLAAVATEKADERAWRTLPGFFSLGRVALPFGTNRIAIHTPAGLVTREVQVSGNHALVVLRTTGPALYVSQTPFDETRKPVVVQSNKTPIKPRGKPVASKPSEKTAK